MTELDAAVAYLAALREYAQTKALSDVTCQRRDEDATNWAYRKMIASHDNLWNTVKESL